MEIVSEPFIVRNYRSSPVKAKSEDKKMHRTYRGVTHDPETDKRLEDFTHKLLAQAENLGEEDIVYELVLRPTGKTSALGKIPWVLVEPHTYGPNPTGELIDE